MSTAFGAKYLIEPATSPPFSASFSAFNTSNGVGPLGVVVVATADVVSGACPAEDVAPLPELEHADRASASRIAIDRRFMTTSGWAPPPRRRRGTVYPCA